MEYIEDHMSQEDSLRWGYEWRTDHFLHI